MIVIRLITNVEGERSTPKYPKMPISHEEWIPRPLNSALLWSTTESLRLYGELCHS